MTEGYAVTEDGIRIHYRVIGEGGETLIAPPKCALEEDLSPLASGRQLVLYDSRSRGGSDAVSLDKVGVELELGDIEAVRRHLSLDSFSLMGWSYLSLVTALYAARYPERVARLVMVGVMPVRKLDHPDIANARQEKFDARFDTAAAEQVKELRAAGIDKSDPERFTRAYWRVMWPTNMVEPGIFDRLRSDPFHYANEHPDHINEHAKILFDLGNWDYRPQAQQVMCPTLVVQGVQDLGPMQGAEEWAAHLRDARLLRIEGAAHWPWLEAPDVFFPAVQQFLQGQWPAAAVQV